MLKNRKVVNMNIRFTENDAGKIQNIAKVMNCTPSEVIRRMVRGTVLRPVAHLEVEFPTKVSTN